MSYTFDGADDTLYTSTLPVGALPFTILAWIKEPTLQSAADVVVNIGESGGGNNYLRLNVNASNQVAATQDAAGAASSSTYTATAISADTWHCAVAVFTSDSSRTVYLDGNAATTQTTTRSTSWASIDRLNIGASGPLAADFNGLIGHVAVWDVALSAGNITSLAGGANPLTIDPTNLIAYWPLTADVNDVVGTNHLTVVNNAAPKAPADDPTVDPYSTIQFFQYQPRLNPLLRM